MAKKQSVPDNIQKQFDKAQFKTSDMVAFTWLGAKKYGYVKTIKEASWGIQYLVESNNTRYPCGIAIKGFKTTYTTGCIDVDETRSIGQDEIKRRIQTGHSSTYAELFTDSGWTKNESRSKSTNSKCISTKNNNDDAKSGVRSKTKNVVKSSINRSTSENKKRRSNTKLDAAVQRQRDFLNSFIKKS
jgi:hypothetical protein